MYYITKAGVKLLNETNKPKLFKKGETGLTPDDHGQSGVSSKKHTRKNFRTIAGQMAKAHAKGKKIWYGREGGVVSRTERLAARYARMKGMKFSAGSLEHHHTDPESKKNTKAHRLFIRKFGKHIADAGRHAFLQGKGSKLTHSIRKGLKRSGVKASKHKDPDALFRKSYAKEDFPKDRPGPLNVIQQGMNRLRRHGTRMIIKKKRKEGHHVVGTYGSGHFEDND